MLGEATMTYYPTGTARSRYAGRNAFTFSIPLVDHPGFDITNKSILLKNLERYNVEIVAEFNNDKVVLIDGKRFRQGEFLNEILIETIENDQITFKMGNTRVIKSVGN